MNLYLLASLSVAVVVIPFAFGQMPTAGICSWYGNGDIPEGYSTYCGEFHRMAKHTAHPDAAKYCNRTLRVTNPKNGKSVVVTVNDKGPDQTFHKDRILDLTYGAFIDIGNPDDGVISCFYEFI